MPAVDPSVKDVLDRSWWRFPACFSRASRSVISSSCRPRSTSFRISIPGSSMCWFRRACSTASPPSCCWPWVLCSRFPLLVVAVTQGGAISTRQLRHGRRYAIAACAAVGAFLRAMRSRCCSRRSRSTCCSSSAFSSRHCSSAGNAPPCVGASSRSSPPPETSWTLRPDPTRQLEWSRERTSRHPGPP